MLRLLLLVSSLTTLLSLSSLLRDTDYLRRSTPFSISHPSPTGEIFTDQGIQSYGFYSHHHLLGFISLQSGTSSLDPEELAAAGPVSSPELGFHWTRTGQMQDYMGGIPDDLVPAWTTHSLPGIFYLCTGDDAGMRHFLHIDALLIPAPTLLTLSFLPWLLYLYLTLRLRHRLSTHHCPHCNYDLRATPTHCPECGHTPPLP